jgi:hypothetical protein
MSEEFRILEERGIRDEKEGLYEKLKDIFYDGGCVYGFTLSNAGIWTAEVCLKI